MLRFYRNDGSTSPATAENVELADDGAFTGWRSLAPAVGWFAGSLSADRAATGCETAIDALAATPALPPPGSSVETLEVPGRDPAVVTGMDEAERAVASLLRRDGATRRVRPSGWMAGAWSTAARTRSLST